MTATRSSISVKLLILSLPLVCIPMAIVGYISYRTSLESAIHLQRDTRILQARDKR